MSTRADVKKLGQLLSQNAYVVPDYQRSYAWEVRQRRDAKDHQVDDFWDDLQQAFVNAQKQILDKKIPQPYYWGTITVKKESNARRVDFINIDEYSIVDGQQRIMTAILFLLAFYRSTSYPSLKALLLAAGQPRLQAGLSNNDALTDLINGATPVRGTHLRTNIRLQRALTYFEQKLHAIPLAQQVTLIDFFLNSTIILRVSKSGLSGYILLPGIWTSFTSYSADFSVRRC